MTAAQSAEAQARLNVCLKDVVDFFEKNKIQDQSIELMNSFIEKHMTNDFLELAESYGKCMAFINHDYLVALLLKSFVQLIDGFIIERKLINKRLRILKEDKKSDPDIIARLENLVIDLDTKKALAVVQCNRLRAMDDIPLEMFKDEKFDPIKYAKDKADHFKALMKAQQKEQALSSSRKI